MRLEQDPIHRHKDVLTHTIAVVENVTRDFPGAYDFRLTRLAALMHDVGKPRTRGYIKGKGVTFYHHEVVGARLTRARLQALRYSNDDVEAVTELVALHLRFHGYEAGWTDSAVRRYVVDAGPYLQELNVLTRCDCTTRNEKKAAMLSRRMDELEIRIAELQENLTTLRILTSALSISLRQLQRVLSFNALKTLSAVHLSNLFPSRPAARNVRRTD